MKNHNHFGPTAHITVDRKRLRQYDDAIYLNNGQEFEIEMFNPLSVSVKAEIHINGIKMNGGGIVIKPGQRIFLERHLDSPNKLVFESYEVETTKEALDAIVNNGDVVVKFYEEKHQNINYTGLFINPSYTTISNDKFLNFTTCNGNSVMFTTTNNLCSISTETGRIEKGNNSGQNFTYDYSSFNYTPRTIVSWKLLPTSVKPYDSKDLKKYCTNCGSKIKKDSFNFCPNCGQKI
jgi:hypothetical protein